MLPFTPSVYRTHEAGSLRAGHVGQSVRLSGWVQSIRRFKRQSFIELRESSGLVQLVVPCELSIEGLSEEACLRIEGTVVARHQVHPQLAQYPTGQVEVQVSSIEILGASGPLPFTRHEQPHEAERMRHRTLCLRWPEAQEPLRQRAAIVRAMRCVAEAGGFLEVETPVLLRHTPGGAQPFLVPVGEGKGYALAQSPQVWKQLLICGGIERYYQLAHCFRNEGARPERQPEFSQFEIEMAFTTSRGVQEVMEAMVQAAGLALGKGLPEVFPRMTYTQAMSQFGTENPHLGNPLRLRSQEATAEGRWQAGESVLVLPRAPTHEEARPWLHRAWTLVGEGVIELEGHTFRAKGALEATQKALGALIPMIGQAWGLIKPGLFPLWVETFPLFERNEKGGWEAAHHPFTRPLAGHAERLTSAPETVMAEAFDLVLNGIEVGGGSMRPHEPALQRKIFSALGWEVEQSEAHFRSLLEALERGAPPHGGMALGVERLVSLLIGASSIREVMAFPKTTGGQCLLTEALSVLPK